MKKWLSVIIPTVLAVVVVVSDKLAPIIANNPKWSAIVAAVIAVLTALAKSPLSGPNA